LERAAAMICEIAGAKVASPVIDVYPIPVLPYPVELKWSNLDRLIGIRIDHDEVRKILKSLDIEILQENENSIQLAIATYRVDVRREADVIEEILRIYGYNNVGLSEQVNSTLSYSPKPDPDKLENLISDQLAAQGFSEMMANSLSPAIYYEKMPLYPETTGVKLLNPLSNDLNYLRRTLLFGALEAVSLNLKYKNNDLRLFEFGNTYSLVEGKNTLLADSYHETRYLAILVTGKNHPEHWSSKVRDSGFYDLKSVVLGVLSRLGISEPDLTLTEGADQRYVLGITGSIGKAECLQMGLIHPDLLESMEIEQPVWFAEINWDVLLKMVKTSLKAQELAKYPIVRRDLALVLDSSVRYQEIRSLAFVVERKLLKEVSVFDVYTSDKLGEGKKSLAVSFYLQDENQTLTDKQIEQVMRKLISAFEDKLGAVLR
jgi:phenylalanyl-tRNA synthetase beta chain